jgi:hypothetical protein
MLLVLTEPSVKLSTTASTAHLHPSGRDAMACVAMGVRGDAKEFQIPWTVIALVAISMMDVLVFAQRSAEYASHDDAMFQFVSPRRKADNDVAVTLNVSPAAPVRISRSSSPSGWISASARAVGSFTSGESRGSHAETRTACGADAWNGHISDMILRYGAKDFGNPEA